MSTTETKIGKHDVLCSSLNFATPEGAAECDCNLSVMADMLQAAKDALESLKRLPDVDGAYRVTCIQQLEAAIKKAEGIV